MTEILIAGETVTYDIGVDIDDVLFPWYNRAHELCELAGITNGVVPTQWRMYEQYGIEADLWASVLDEATFAGELYTVPPIPGAVEALRRLLFAGHRIHLITARGTGAWQTLEQQNEIERQTYAWLTEFAVPRDTLTFASDKARIARDNDLDFFIDDGVHNFEALEQGAPKTQTYLLTAPHNGDYYTPFRLDTMDDFVDIIFEVGERGARL